MPPSATSHHSPTGNETNDTGDDAERSRVGEPSRMEAVEPVGTVDDRQTAVFATVTYYTDPLCSWSWALEPQWRLLRSVLGAALRVTYVMGGLLQDWERFSDPLNAVSRPIQMGPIWVEVRHLSGMPLDDRLWVEDPPTSSLPGCLAVKAAATQGPEQEEQYLRRLREAAMLERRNIAREDELIRVAEAVAAWHPFDVARFSAELRTATTREALREDLRATAAAGVGRFPTLTIERPGKRGILITGYRPYDILRAAVAEVLPEIDSANDVRPESVPAYLQRWGSATSREIAEALGVSPADANQQLAKLVASGEVCRVAGSPDYASYGLVTRPDGA